MIMHGGDDGQLDHYGFPNDYVFDWTCAELQSRLDIGEGERMPTLDELIEVCQGAPEVLLNIELKAPCNAVIANRYDHFLAAQIVCNAIARNHIARKTMVSSFDQKVI